MRNRIGPIVLWGSLWGIAEATLGYFLHMLPVNIGWIVWFPLAFFFLSMVRRITRNNESMIFSAGIAAAIKFVDVMLPGTIDRVLNPSVSILLEALAVYLYYKIIAGKKYPAVIEYTGAFATSILWRIFYAGYILLLPAWMVKISPVSNINAFIDFLLFQGAVNGILTYVIFGSFHISFTTKKVKSINHKFGRPMSFAFPYLALSAAILIQLLI